MININHTELLSSPVRKIKGKVELYSSAEPITYSYTDKLKSFTIERVGEGRFFGYGICQKVNIHLIDTERLIYPSTSDFLKVYLTVSADYPTVYPSFYVSENHRDELTNELSITAYDKLYSFGALLVGELGLVAPYSIRDVAEACARLMGGELELINIDDGSIDLSYADGANIEGTETVREILNAIAEATQSIYYLNSADNLVFKRLNKDGAEVLAITKNDYIELKSGDNRRLQTIVSATALGDNYSAGIDAIGSTHYIRDNPFFELREDITEILERAVAAVGGLSINQFEMSWRGNYLLEPGDKIAITTKDNDIVYSFLLDESISYNGYLSSKLRWSYEENESESVDNPITLGDSLKYTYAKVDKANKEIEIMASDVKSLSRFQMNTENILATVNSELDDLSQKAEVAITKEDINIQIENAMKNGVDNVITTTGFTFNDEGLTVSKSGSEMATQITEDGMSVYRGNSQVLTADNTGVKAENLHATTYLIIGDKSRLENYGSRTGCFWIGG